MSKYTFKSTRLELIFIPLIDAERLVPKPSWALISICDPALKPCIRYEQWSHSIRLNFEDVASDEDGIVFSKTMAVRLIEFALALPEAIDLIVIHCIVGVSRSGAVMKFLTKFIYKDCYNFIFDKGYHTYNYTVYKTLVRVWKKRRSNARTTLTQKNL
ncbi:MAG: hypothetical protein LLG37_08540 [Spirochaetia bacterium]|nr:hypothetical protein [Spirochaetia bacterium]